LGDVDALHVQCAWALTGFRIVHSLVQATVNIVLVRLAFFVDAWISLGIMIFREAIAGFS